MKCFNCAMTKQEYLRLMARYHDCREFPNMVCCQNVKDNTELKREDAQRQFYMGEVR